LTVNEKKRLTKKGEENEKGNENIVLELGNAGI
jgi:hypothetical protein